MSVELENGVVALLLDERPATGGELRFCLPGKRFRDGTTVSIMKGSYRFSYGTFARGETSFYALLRGPSTATIIAVSGGALYVVPAQEPQKYWTVGDGYIEGVLVDEPHNMAVAWSPWGIVAFSDTAVPLDVPVGADGFRSMHIDSRTLVGEAYLPERSAFVPFRLDIIAGNIGYSAP